MPDTTHLVLVVDDDDLLRKSICGALEQAGFQVISAVDGEEGLAEALKSHPDVTVLDYQMPRLDGLGMLEKLRQDEWGAKADVILATNVYDVNLMNAVMKLGVNEYIMKSSTSLEEIAIIVKSHVSPEA